MKPCCIIGFLLSGNAVVLLAPSGPLSSMPAFSIADVMIWIRNVQGLWEIVVLCRLSSCSDGMLNTQKNIKSSKSWGQAQLLQNSLSGLCEADGPVALCSSLQVVTCSQISQDRIPTLVILSRQYY